MIGLLGGASQQAVSQSGNPVRWLQKKLREILTPDVPTRYHRYIKEDVGAAAKVRASAYVKEVKERLSHVPAENKATGRPSERSPEALAVLLGVEYEEGKDLYWVLLKYIATVINSLTKLFKPDLLWKDLFAILDQSWLPRYMRAEPVYPEESDDLLALLT
jgi:hypothetical protein